MKFTQEIKNQQLRIVMQGDLIGENQSIDLKYAVESALDRGVKKTIIDMGQVRYMNSSGLGVLITLLTKMRNKDGELMLANLSEHVEKLLVITKLNSVFKTV